MIGKGQVSEIEGRERKISYDLTIATFDVHGKNSLPER